MSFSISGFGHILLEVADEVDPGLDVATEEAKIGAEVVEKGTAIEQEIVDDLKAFARKHLAHLGGLSFAGQHVGTIDVAAAVKAETDPAPAEAPVEPSPPDPTAEPATPPAIPTV